MTEPVLPKTFPGATKVSVAVLGLLALFMGALFVLALVDHGDHGTLATTGAGAFFFVVLALAQWRMLRNAK